MKMEGGTNLDGELDVLFTKALPKYQLLQKFKNLMEEYHLPNEKILYHALKHALFEIVQDLLNQGLNPNVIRFEEEYNIKPLHMAVNDGHTEIAQLLITNGAILNSSPNSMTELYTAVSNCDYEMVKILLSYGADPNISCFGKTLIHLATDERFFTREILLELLKYGANVNSKDDYYGFSPLHIASHEANLEAMEILLRWGADSRSLNSKKESPLHILSLNPEDHSNEIVAKAVSLLSKYGIDINAQTIDGNAPIHYAVLKGNASIVNCLQRLHTDWENVRDVKGFSAFENALFDKNMSIVKSFLVK